MTNTSIAKWTAHTFSSGSCTGEDYIKFQREMKNDLNKQLKAVKGVDLKLHSFNKGHYFFSAVVTDGKKFVYVSIPDVRGLNKRLFDNVLFRTMAHDKDWTGGNNNYCHWNDIGEKCGCLILRQYYEEL